MKFKFFRTAFFATMLTLCACGDNGGGSDPTPDPTPENIFDVADMPGKNVKGVVYCAGKAVEGAVVSDGEDVAVTDSKGHYYLNSTKKSGSVSVSIPKGYVVSYKGIYPDFYKKFTDSDVATVERHDFELKKSDRDNYVVVFLADVQIGGLYEAASQFTKKFLPDVRTTILEYKNAGKDVYVITLGDQSHDLYWYTHNVNLVQCMEFIAGVNSPTFNTMGNHDNDPYCPGDYDAEKLWRENIGPKNYSFNIGEVHYIVLDNIVYVNSGAAAGQEGDRKYEKQVTAAQLAWLKKDLAQVKDKATPIMVCMHAPSFDKPKMYDSETKPRIRYTSDFSDRASLISAFSGFSNVTFMTGHTHTNYSNAENNIREYTVGAVNGTLWRSAAPGNSDNNVCVDGSPAGYLVMEVDGKTYTTRYKSAGYDRNYQFRCYDANKSRIVKSRFFPNSSSTNAKAESSIRSVITDGAEEYLDEWFTEDYRTDNMVFVNVFAWDDRWKVEMSENGKSLAVTQVNALDPYQLISLGCRMLDNNEKITNGPLPSLTAHMFRAQASAPNTTITVKVTDAYGNVYTEDMVRPRQLALDMK